MGIVEDAKAAAAAAEQAVKDAEALEAETVENPTPPTVTGVVVSFSDGTSVSLPADSVDAPINANIGGTIADPISAGNPPAPADGSATTSDASGDTESIGGISGAGTEPTS